jgi:hypothetical protein
MSMQESTQGQSGDFRVLMLKIREADLPRTLEAIEHLKLPQENDSDVQGYAFGRQPTVGGAAGIGGAGGIQNLSGTQCTVTKGYTGDFNCGDGD